MKLFKELFLYRSMISNLVRKDLRGRYKGSVLGFLWTFINPLFQLIVYTIVFATILRSDIDKYYLFLFVALIPWIFFSTCLTGAATCFLGQSAIVTKIYFPREVLPISFVTSAFVNMLYCFIIVFIVVAFSGVGFVLEALIWLPIVMAIEYILGLGIALISSSITVYFRDLEHILGILSLAWMYMTPIMYSSDVVPKAYQFYFNLNPMTPIISAYRDILYYGRVPEALALIQAFSFGMMLLMAGIMTFGQLKRRFAEEL